MRLSCSSLSRLDGADLPSRFEGSGLPLLHRLESPVMDGKAKRGDAQVRRRDFLQAAGSALSTAAVASPAPQIGGAMPTFDQTPDKPRSFGYKISWFAVKHSDPASVLDALEFGAGKQANWASGLSAAYETSQRTDAWVFVSPPVSGWVLVVGSSLPYPVAATEPLHNIGTKFDALFSRLMKRFPQVQFFGSYRVVGFV